MRHPRVLATLAASVLVAVSGPPAANASPAPVSIGYTVALGSPVTVKVAGNQLVNGSGAPVRLYGVDHMGGEYSCVKGTGILAGPVDQAAVDLMHSWGSNAVRVPLNEDCWLGINGVAPSLSGVAYQTAIHNYVAELHADGMAAILDLHWSAPGSTLATSQQDMADADHSPAFWSSVAGSFAADPGVLFDLYNEPHGISWSCWQSGCATPGFATAGMQQLVDAVRAAGANQPILLGGLGYASSLAGPAEGGTDPSTGWLGHLPADPAGQLVASQHEYDTAGCATQACWDQTIAPVAATYPVVTGEVGEFDCTATFTAGYLAWADAHGLSTLGWTWNPPLTPDPSGCGSANPNVIDSYSGTPSIWGAALHSDILSQATAHASPTVVPVGGSPSAAIPEGQPLILLGTGVAVAVVAVVRRRLRAV